MKQIIWPAFILILFLLASCNKQDEGIKTVSISTYFPTEVGKYITYRLDSTVFVSFGTSAEVHSYDVKYYTDAEITDNLGRKAYRIIRFIRPDANAAWTPDATFMAVDDTSAAEFIENNLRYTKLVLPIKNGISWKGNAHIDTYSFNSTVRYLDDWDYTYDSVGKPYSVGNFYFENTVKVNQRDEVIGNPDDPLSYSEINFGEEKYAEGVGMVYRRFFHSEYQPGGGGFFAEGSYGVTYTITDYN
jgi:hypothetical protein